MKAINEWYYFSNYILELEINEIVNNIKKKEEYQEKHYETNLELDIKILKERKKKKLAFRN